jgi:MarR family transcriptional regulator, transcriptional regulator for hemolysin
MPLIKNKHHPLGKIFATLTKQYVGVVSEQLKHIDLERYWYVLLIISEAKNSITQKELGDLIGHDKTSMVRIVDYLSKKGYVKRKQNAEDRREYFIELTAKAQKILPEIKSAFENMNKAALKGIKKEQLECLSHCLATIENNLKSLPSASVNLDFKRTGKS